MKRFLISGAAALAAVVMLAACGGGDGDSAATTVSVQELGSTGFVLVDSAGRALYVSDEEAGRDIVCTGACTSFWAPLTVGTGAPKGSSLSSDLGVVDRPDGTRQVTYDGKRLYTFTEDQPGEVTGDGFSDAFEGQRFTWHVVHADRSQSTSSDDGGRFGY